jgi:hypothetical protein
MAETMNQVSVLIVHLLAVVACVYLWRRAPDPVQRGILIVIAAAMIVYTFCDGLSLYGVGRSGNDFLGIDRVWKVKIWADGFAHFAVLLYLARQWWLTTGFCAALKEGRSNA